MVSLHPALSGQVWLIFGGVANPSAFDHGNPCRHDILVHDVCR